MEAEIIAVGTELLLGDILNTNAQFLSRELAALGITVHFQTVVGDNPARLESVVRQARGRSDLLVFSGGLGPTEDDLTKQTVARAFGDTLRFDEAELEKIRAFFTAWGRTMPENNKKQAMVPTHGRKIPNANGTAPGMIFEDQAAPGKYAVLLPGPPKELQPMFLNSVKPWLAAMSDSVLHSVTLRVTGVGESHLESRIGHLLENANPTAAVYAKTAEVVIRITAKAASENEARRMCLDYAKHFYDILGDCVYAMDADSLEEVVVKELAARPCPAQAVCSPTARAPMQTILRKKCWACGMKRWRHTAPYRPRQPPRWPGACAKPPGRISAWVSQASRGRAAARRKSPWDLCIWPLAVPIPSMYRSSLSRAARARWCVCPARSTRWRWCAAWRWACRSRPARPSRRRSRPI